ncbi:nuclear transport factor 2 family protein [Bacillus salacetis]|uniref:Nuclear transport factor 2 family protein n=1 Tax=Bacillus salacetis TaxID=2315464 RepID=A0A3A1QZC8_9BACI|nr:nuclear transport factor 2 family protein [Bacillus salacetis]RIW34646.1 nuclear transport factor 2 family protein [Bacillus salacetis]
MSSNKETAESFLQMAASGKAREAFQLYIAEGFIHHNPFFSGDAESLISAMDANAEQNPDKTFEVKQTIEEEQKIAVHSHVKQHPHDPGAAVIHIFRFEHGRIVELWDIGQGIPENSPNKNGIF